MAIYLQLNKTTNYKQSSTLVYFQHMKLTVKDFSSDHHIIDCGSNEWVLRKQSAEPQKSEQNKITTSLTAQPNKNLNSKDSEVNNRLLHKGTERNFMYIDRSNLI